MQKKWIITIVVVLVVGLIGFNIWNNTKTTTADVETVSLKEEQMKESVMTPGKLKLKDEQFIYYQADKGEVTDIFVEPGDSVKKDDKLLEYENKQLDLEKQQNQLQINLAYLELDDLKKEHQDIDKEVDKDPDNEMIQEEHDQIKLQQQQKNIELEQTLLEKETIEQEIEEAVVTADVSGTVLTVDEEASSGGQMAENAMIRIGSLDDVIVEGSISEYDTLKIKQDQAVILTSDAVPDEKWHGSISYISDLPDEASMEAGQEEAGVTYPIEVTLDDDVNVKPGFKMLIEIVTSDKKVDTLPLSAVLQEESTNYVYLVEDGKAKRTEVEIGSVDTEKMEIKDGVTKKDNVIADPTDEIKDGMDVTEQ